MDGVEQEEDLCLRGGVVTQRLCRRVGVRGPGVEMAMDDLDGALDVVEVVILGRGSIMRKTRGSDHLLADLFGGLEAELSSRAIESQLVVHRQADDGPCAVYLYRRDSRGMKAHIKDTQVNSNER